jgi:outer membrane lipoprotein SlyB
MVVGMAVARAAGTPTIVPCPQRLATPGPINQNRPVRVAGWLPLLEPDMYLLPRWSCVASALWLGSALVACAAVPADTPPPEGSMMNAAASQPGGAATAVAYGSVRSIENLDNDTRRGSGAILGGIIGAVIGRQIGETSAEKNVGTVIGAAAGAAIGHEIEKNARRETGGVRITVTLDDGSTRRFDFQEAGGLRVGDRVRIEGNNLLRIV